MGIFQRISTLFRSNANAALDSLSDPGKEIDQAVLDMETDLRRARGDLTATLATEKRLRVRMDEYAAHSRQWSARAEQALLAGDEGLARQALERQMAIDGEAKLSLESLKAESARTESLKEELRRAELRLQQIKLRKESIKAQARQSKQAEKGSGATTALERFEQSATAIDVAEAELALDEELKAARHEDAKSLEVERKLAALDKDQDLTDRLAALKAKMDKK